MDTAAAHDHERAHELAATPTSYALPSAPRKHAADDGAEQPHYGDGMMSTGSFGGQDEDEARGPETSAEVSPKEDQEEEDTMERKGHENKDVVVVAPVHDDSIERTMRLAYAIASLRMYNPDFHLTTEVIEILRVFFDDMDPDHTGTIPLRALVEEMERLDPHQELVSEETRQLIWREIREKTKKKVVVVAGEEEERIDFNAFCAWVMRWKEIHPASVQNVYTSWAQQLAAMDFGLSEGDGVFVVPSDEIPPREELRSQLAELLLRRMPRRHAHLRDRPSRKPSSSSSSSSGVAMDNDGAPLGGASTGSDGFSTSGSNQSSSVTTLDGDDNASSADQEGGLAATNGDSATPPPPPTTISKLQGSFTTVSKSFIAGGLAGMAAKSALAPVDRIKLLFQVSDNRSFSFRNAFHLAKEIYTQDGFRALFRGNMLNIIRVVPYAGVQHSSFDFFRRQFHEYNYKQAEKIQAQANDQSLSLRHSKRDYTKLTNMQLVAAGSMAGGLSLTLSYPLDIVRARFMVQHGKHTYTSIYQGILEMYRVDGARSFSRGLLPSLMGTLPYTGIGFTLNEKFKHWLLDVQQRRALHPDDAPTRLHPFSKLACSYFAACIAQTATYPMDTIRRRIQTDGFVSGNGKTLRYTGVATTARLILANEGWRGFFKGVSVNWMRSPLATGISLTAYDLLKEVLDVEQVG